MAHAMTIHASSPNRRRWVRQRVADLTSSTGAMTIGLGAGLLLGARLAAFGPWLVLVGVLLHAWGMSERHRLLHTATVTPPLWWRTLHLACWTGLAVIVAYAGVTLAVGG